MVDSYLRDVGYLTSDLMTGKSLPVLAAIALLPLDASLLGTMVCLVVWCPCLHVHLKQVEQVLAGVFGGSCVTLWYAWNRASPGPLTWGMRFLNLSFGAYLNMAFALHVVCLAGEGTAWLLPAFCVVMQAVPERPTTLVVLGSLTFCLFYVSVFETASFRLTAGVIEGSMLPVSVNRRRLQGASNSLAIQAVMASLGNSLVILLLTVYATACAPVHRISWWPTCD